MTRARTHTWLMAVAVGILVSACARGLPEPQTPSQSAPVPPTQAPPSTPKPSPTVTTAMDAYLPAMLNGIAAHRFAVGTDMLERLVTDLGVAADDLEVAFASDHGASFVQTYAIRVAGTSGAELLEALPPAAYDPSGGGTTSTHTETIGGHEVQVIENDALAGQIGIYYALTVDDVLVVVQAFDPGVAAAALTALPFQDR